MRKRGEKRVGNKKNNVTESGIERQRVGAKQREIKRKKRRRNDKMAFIEGGWKRNDALKTREGKRERMKYMYKNK